MQSPFTLRPVLMAAVLVASLVHTAGAQDVATSFEQLRGVVGRGDVVTVVNDSGGVLKGRIADLSPATLKLLLGGFSVELPIGDVRSISQERHLDVGKGAAWGFGVGAGLAGLLTLPAWNSNCRGCGSFVVTSVLITGGLGAGIGASVAAAVFTTHVLFVNPTNKTALTFAPLADRGQRGVRVSWEF